MDVEEYGSVPERPAQETLFAKSEELSVVFYANLPGEVKQTLKGAGICKALYETANPQMPL